MLTLLWRCRRWWCPPAGLLWALPAGLVEAKHGAVPGAIRVAVALIVVAGMAWWWPPTRLPLNLLRRALGVGGPREKKNAEKKSETAETATVRPGRAELLSLGGEPKPRRWAVAGLVPFGPMPRWCVGRSWPPVWREERGYVTAILGSGGTGKSYLLLSLAMAMLQDGEWLGRKVLRCTNVLYVDAELDAETQRERGYQVARGMGLSRPPGPAHWWQVPWSWIRPYGLHYYQTPCSVGTPEGLELVGRQVRRTRADAVCFDSLTIGAAGTALSDQNGWNTVLSGMEAWGKPTILIDHMGKAGGGGMVGSFMKQAKVRSAVELERQSDGTVTVEHVKANFGPILPVFSVRPVFEHCDPDDPAPGAVRFDLTGAAGATRGTARTTTGTAGTSPAAVVLAAFTAKGGATVKEIAEATGLAPQTVARIKDSLLKAGALAKGGKVATGGRAGEVFVATGGGIGAGDADTAVAQAETLLRSALASSPSEGVQGVQGVQG